VPNAKKHLAFELPSWSRKWIRVFRRETSPTQTLTDQGNVKVTPTPITAAIAGLLAGLVMPVLWLRLGGEGLALVAAFLLVVALPAHAFVVGFSHGEPAASRTLDIALLKRVGAWLSAAVVAIVFTHVFVAQ
jgi:hypothetical protein